MIDDNTLDKIKIRDYDGKSVNVTYVSSTPGEIACNIFTSRGLVYDKKVYLVIFDGDCSLVPVRPKTITQLEVIQSSKLEERIFDALKNGENSFNVPLNKIHYFIG